MATQKLPVFRTAGNAIKLPFADFDAFWKIAFIPMIFGIFGHLFFYPLGVWGSIMLMVGWSRYVLLGETMTPLHSPGGMRELRVIGYWALLALIVFAVVLVLVLPFVGFALFTSGGNPEAMQEMMKAMKVGLVIPAIGVILTFIMAYFALRMSFLSPNVALDQKGLKSFYRQTKGCVWRLLGLMTLTTLVTLPLTLLARFTLGILEPLAWGISAGAVALAYKHVVGDQAAPKE